MHGLAQPALALGGDGADDAQIYGLQRVRAGEPVSVASLVFRLEALAERRHRRSSEPAVGQRHGQLERLSAVTHVGQAPKADARGIVAHPTRYLSLQAIENAARHS